MLKTKVTYGLLRRAPTGAISVPEPNKTEQNASIKIIVWAMPSFEALVIEFLRNGVHTMNMQKL